MNIVTKSGTNSYSGSCFALFRDKSLNAQHPLGKVGARAARPTTGATSSAARSAGPSCRTGAFYFVAVERTQQDTNQAVEHPGLYPAILTASIRRRSART